MVVLEKEQGRAASIDLLRIYGHPYFKYHEDKLFHSQKREKVEEVLLGYGFDRQDRWDVDDETLVTLHDMAKLRGEYAGRGERERLAGLEKDIKTVLAIGEKIRQLQTDLKYINARSEFEKVKDTKDEIALLREKRDKFDEKYETRRFEAMLEMTDYDNRHDELLRGWLVQDKAALEEERRRREEEARQREQELNDEFEQVDNNEDEWWKQQN